MDWSERFKAVFSKGYKGAHAEFLKLCVNWLFCFLVFGGFVVVRLVQSISKFVEFGSLSLGNSNFFLHCLVDEDLDVCDVKIKLIRRESKC